MVSFIHSGDWQLGMTLRHLDADGQARFTGARNDTIRAIGELAAKGGAAFVVVAGDVFENHNISPTVWGRALEAMRDTGVDIYLLPGNHDPLSPGSLWLDPAFIRAVPPNVHVIDTTEPIAVGENVEIVGVPWLSKNPGKDPLTGVLSGLEPTSKTRILVGHGMVDVLNPNQLALDSISIEKLRGALVDGLVDYVALGDRHIAWVDEVSGAIAYSGCHEATDFAEPSRGTVLEVSLGEAVEITKHVVGTWQYVDISADLSSDEDLDRFERDLDSLTGKDTLIVRTSLTGALTLDQHGRLDAILERAATLFATLYAWGRRTHVTVLDTDIADEAFGGSGFVADAAAELQELSAAGNDDATQSLKLLYRLVNS